VRNGTGQGQQVQKREPREQPQRGDLASCEQGARGPPPHQREHGDREQFEQEPCEGGLPGTEQGSEDENSGKDAEDRRLRWLSEGRPAGGFGACHAKHFFTAQVRL
jgi:hypothetical protein